MIRKSKNQRGFTLVESIVTMVILSMLLGLAYQSMSVFLDASNRSTSRFLSAERNIDIRLKLKASLRSMLDYYVKSNNKPKELYIINEEKLLQYVSTSSQLFESHREVVVRLSVEPLDEGSLFKFSECPLTELMPTELTTEWPTSKNCRSHSYVFNEDSINFEVEMFSDAKATLGFDILNPNGGTFQHKEETDHLLPKRVTVRLKGINTVTLWKFSPQVENRKKYLEDYGAGFNI